MIYRSRAAIAVLTAFSVIATACSSGETPGASQSAAAGGKPYAGTTIRVLGANHPWADALKPLLSDFEAKTGIKVNLEQYGEDQLTQKLTTEFTAGSSDVDAFMQRPLQEAKLHQQNGYYTDLNAFLKDSKKTPADYDVNDISKAALGTETVGDVLTGIPIVVESEVLYYRKDLLQAANIAVPKTLDELKAAAAKLTDKGKEQYGFVARGQRSPSVTQFSSFLYSFGGDWFDLKTKKATIDTPEFIQAVTFYGSLLRDYGPPGVLNMSFPQAAAVVAQGKGVQYTDANSIYQLMLDPTRTCTPSRRGASRCTRRRRTRTRRGNSSSGRQAKRSSSRPSRRARSPARVRAHSRIRRGSRSSPRIGARRRPRRPTGAATTARSWFRSRRPATSSVR
jgi:multiple sugar transport system substrate-binding protein